MNIRSLFSTVGLFAIAVVLVISVGLISALPSLRIDLTEDNLYTLSEGTHNIVSNLETPIEFLFFYSDSATEDVPQIRSYGNRVQELLREIVMASDGALSLRVIDPEPFSEDEDLATAFGIQSVPISQGSAGVYFGLVVVEKVSSDLVPMNLRRSETLPLIRPDQEEFLEYEFMKLVNKVENPERVVVGLITELNIDGGFNPSTGQATPSWVMMDIIRQLYEVKRVDITQDSIEAGIDILLIVHPQNLSPQMLYAIDQHVLAGGKALVFLDPNADSLVGRSPQGTMIPAGMSSDMPVLLSAWGIDYDPTKVLTDSDFALRVMMGQNQRPVAHLGMLGIQRAGLTMDDIVTSRLEMVNLSSVGSISAKPDASTLFQPLIMSSSNAMLMDAGLLEDVTDPSILHDEFVSQDRQFVIAARVSGAINTAFPDGRPVVIDAVVEAVNEATSDSAEDAVESDTAAVENELESGAETESAELEEVHLVSSTGEVNILVFADTDFLSDRLWVQVAQFMGQRIPQPFANNGDIVINSLDNLSGSADLVSIRSRGRYSRPFTRVLSLQLEADARLRSQEAELLESLAATEDSLSELNRDEEGNPLPQVSPQAQAEIERFNEELLDTRRRLRDVQFQLNADIEKLGSTLKLINTALMPLLLTLLVLVAGFVRSRRRKLAL